MTTDNRRMIDFLRAHLLTQETTVGQIETALIAARGLEVQMKWMLAELEGETAITPVPAAPSKTRPRQPRTRSPAPQRNGEGTVVLDHPLIQEMKQFPGIVAEAQAQAETLWGVPIDLRVWKQPTKKGVPNRKEIIRAFRTTMIRVARILPKWWLKLQSYNFAIPVRSDFNYWRRTDPEWAAKHDAFFTTPDPVSHHDLGVPGYGTLREIADYYSVEIPKGKSSGALAELFQRILKEGGDPQ